MHVTDLVIHAHKFHNEAILLIHFSPRYKRQEILDALDTNLPPALRAKCIPFLNGFA
jgi:ribonuclease Z